MSVLNQVINTIESKGYSINQENPQGMTFKNDIGCDSLDCIEIGMELDTHFGIDIPDEIWHSGTTIGDIVLFIESSTK